MLVDNPVTYVPASPDYVLSVFCDELRQYSQLPEGVDGNLKLSFETTIAEWRAALDLLPWRELAHGMNQYWKIDCSDEQWQAVLEPEREKRLVDVCELIAQYAVRAVVQPVSIASSSCRTAGAFLAIRSILVEAGAQASEIGPSTPLAPFTRRYAQQFLGAISQLAPGTLPLVHCRLPPVYYAGLISIILGSVLLGIGSHGGIILGWLMGTVLFVGGFLFTENSPRWLLYDSVEFGELRTFRDMAEVVAKHDATEDVQ